MSKRILIIDDDDLVLKSLRRLLLLEQYDIICAENGDQAENILKKEPVDLIISDIQMPGKDGVSTVRNIQDRVKKAAEKEIPIIFLTGYAALSRELHANFLGEILYKPIDRETLLQSIRDYL